MAVSSGQVAVGTAATVIPVTSVNPYELHVHNNDNSDDLYIGGAAVTTSTGLLLEKLESVTLLLRPTDRLFVVSSKTGHTVSYLAITKDI